MSIETQVNDGNTKRFYCSYTLLVEWEERLSAVVDIRACMPSMCSTKHFVNALNKLQMNVLTAYNDNFSIWYDELNCIRDESDLWTYGGIIVLVILGIFTCLLVVCTICDIYMRTTNYSRTEGVRIKLLSEFSLYTNSLRTLSTKTPPGYLPVISGLRFFTMCWVIFQHTCSHYFGTNPPVNVAVYYQWIYSFESLHYVTSAFAVDTFFAISGFLVSYIFLKKMSKGQTFNPLQYYMHRYLRLTPAVGALLLLRIFIFPRLGSGRRWFENLHPQKDLCTKTWWYVLLYIHNYVTVNAVSGLTHLWYLEVDMQLFWISPIILYPLAKKPTVGLIILLLVTIASIITPAVISAKYEYSNAYLLSFNSNSYEAAQYFLGPAYTRAGPYLIGIFFGYMLACKKGHGKIILIKLAWISMVLSLGFIFFSYRYYQSKTDHKYGDYYLYWEVFYSGFSHHIWGLGVCCIIYVSSCGYGGIVNKFLSHPVFFPLSKISYSVYIVHAMILAMIFVSDRSVHYFTTIDLANTFFSMTIWSLISGFIYSLFFETPFIVLETIIRGDVAVVAASETDCFDNSQSQNPIRDEKIESNQNIVDEIQVSYL